VSLTTVPLSVAQLCGCEWRILATQTPKAAHREQLQSGCFALRAEKNSNVNKRSTNSNAGGIR